MPALVVAALVDFDLAIQKHVRICAQLGHCCSPIARSHYVRVLMVSAGKKGNWVSAYRVASSVRFMLIGIFPSFLCMRSQF